MGDMQDTRLLSLYAPLLRNHKEMQKGLIGRMGPKRDIDAHPQALAPCRPAGCCVVVELVSRTLFIGFYILFLCLLRKSKC